MSPLVKKEIRLLMPSFGFACVLALPNFFFSFNNDGSLKDALWFVLAIVFCGAMTIMMALNSFGSEISSGTFSNLLAQPVSRQKIWDTKILVLAISLSIIGIFWSYCGIVRLLMIGHDLNLLDLFTGIGTFGLVVFSGGLWTVLLLRQVAAAFWFTVLVPGALFLILAASLGDIPDEVGNGIVAIVLGIYSLCGLFFARWLFFRAQDVQWTGGAITMPEMRGFPAWLSWPTLKRMKHPRAALWRKEFQLHQWQFIMAFALVVLHLGVLATRKLGHFPKNSTTEYVLESFWALWLVMPFLAGCAAAAEERKMGTHESQLCLPVKQRKQFTVKLSVVLILSILFGVVIPLLLEGTRILPVAQIKFFDDLNSMNGQFSEVLQKVTTQTFWGMVFYCIAQINHFLPLLTLAGMATAIGAVSFYVSTLTRSMLQALAPAVVGISLTFFLLFFAMVVAERPQNFNLPWEGWLIYFIGVPVMLVALFALAFWNFRQLTTGWKLWLRNLLILAMSLGFACATTTAIYHRFWEKFTPLEPPHGAERLSLANPPQLNQEWGAFLSLRLPDGKDWVGSIIASSNSLNPASFMLGNLKFALGDGEFINGSNWLSVQRASGEIVGIKSDGTLWVSEKPKQNSRVPYYTWVINDDIMRNLVQFGSETNWKSAGPGGYSTLLVKNDGTLWRWGPTNFDSDKKRWPGLRAFTPYRLGTESNWVGIIREKYQGYLQKLDGSIWSWNDDWETNDNAYLALEPGLIAVQIVPSPGCDKYNSIADIGACKVGIRDDKPFRIWAEQNWRKTNRSKYGNWYWTAEDIQIGKGANWLAVAGPGDKIVTLKDDGTLWLWDFFSGPQFGWDPGGDVQKILKVKPVRLGTHADWIAIASAEGGITSLAADGSLWYWPLGPQYYYYNFQFEPLLDISRKPQLLGNIFKSQN